MKVAKQDNLAVCLSKVAASAGVSLKVAFLPTSCTPSTSLPPHWFPPQNTFQHFFSQVSRFNNMWQTILLWSSKALCQNIFYFNNLQGQQKCSLSCISSRWFWVYSLNVIACSSCLKKDLTCTHHIKFIKCTKVRCKMGPPQLLVTFNNDAVMWMKVSSQSTRQQVVKQPPH